MSAIADINPIDYPEAWDVVLIAGEVSPGVCEIGEWKRQHDFDIKAGKGSQGATITFTQKPPAEGSIKFLLWKPEHFTAWDLFVPLLKYDATKKAVQAVEIFHPGLALIDINSVVTTKIGNVIHEGQQLYSITVDFLEYFPPKPQLDNGTPNTSNTQSSQGRTQLNEQPKPAALTAEELLQQLKQEAAKPI